MGKRSKKKGISQDNDESPNPNDEMPENPSVENVNSEKANNTNKRPLDDNDHDSDTEVQAKKPKKKKKKNQMPTEESAGNNQKNKKSIRQMKKEKHAQRQAEAAAHSKDQLKSQCLNYLSQWKHDRQNWKFMKVKQVWLFKNKFSKVLVPETSWPVLLEYFESSQGNIRKMLLDDAHKIIKQMDEWTESQDKNEDDANDENHESEDTTVTKPDDVIYSRARSLIQCLQE